MKNDKELEAQLLRDHVKSLPLEKAQYLAWQLLYWQVLEIGEDVRFRHPRLGHEDVLDSGEIYWSSTGESLVGGWNAAR